MQFLMYHKKGHIGEEKTFVRVDLAIKCNQQEGKRDMAKKEDLIQKSKMITCCYTLQTAASITHAGRFLCFQHNGILLSTAGLL